MAGPTMSLPIFYINLARDTERRQKLEAELARQGLQGTRFEAVWWANLGEAEQKQLYSAELNKHQFHASLVNGEKGCYASHIRLWQQLLASGAPAMVVLEDDVGLKDGFADILGAISQRAQPWDMVKLIGRERDSFRGSCPLSEGVELVDYKRVPSMTAGYAISRQGAQKLCQSRLPFGRPIDVDLRYWWETIWRCWACPQPRWCLTRPVLPAASAASPPPCGWGSAGASSSASAPTVS